ncbi:MAG: hypothetical protein WBQ78_06180 [Gammaproteobacteria bacterium]
MRAKPHPLYLALAHGDEALRAVNRKLFHNQLDGAVVDEIRAATNGNYDVLSPSLPR